jgi:hypothetical protein
VGEWFVAWPQQSPGVSPRAACPPIACSSVDRKSLTPNSVDNLNFTTTTFAMAMQIDNRQGKDHRPPDQDRSPPAAREQAIEERYGRQAGRWPRRAAAAAATPATASSHAAGSGTTAATPTGPKAGSLPANS